MKSSIAPGYPGIRRLAVAAALSCMVLSWPLAGAAQPAAAGVPASPQAVSTAAQSDPRQVAATVAEVQALRKAGRGAEALPVLEAALRSAPRDAQLRFLYGLTVAEAGRAGDAIAVFESLTVDFPELPEPYNNLAVMHAAQGDLDKARAALENAVRALPGYALAHENLGDLYLRLAARAWARAAELDATSRSAPARLEAARTLIQQITPPAQRR